MSETEQFIDELESEANFEIVGNDQEKKEGENKNLDNISDPHFSKEKKEQEINKLYSELLNTLDKATEFQKIDDELKNIYKAGFKLYETNPNQKLEVELELLKNKLEKLEPPSKRQVFRKVYNQIFNRTEINEINKQIKSIIERVNNNNSQIEREKSNFESFAVSSLASRRNIREEDIKEDLSYFSVREKYLENKNKLDEAQQRINELEQYFYAKYNNLSADKEKIGKTVLVKGASSKGVGYKNQFRVIRKEIPNIVSIVKDLLSSVKRYQPITKEGIRLEIFESKKMPVTSLEDLNSYTNLYRLTVPGVGSFFLKKQDAKTRQWHGGGFSQFKDSEIAQEALKDLPFARVIDYQFGYQDKDESFFLAKWEYLGMKPSQLENYIENLHRDGKLKEVKELEEERNMFFSKVQEIESTINNSGEGQLTADMLVSNNWSFDDRKKQFVLFDVGGRI